MPSPTRASSYPNPDHPSGPSPVPLPLTGLPLPSRPMIQPTTVNSHLWIWVQNGFGARISPSLGPQWHYFINCSWHLYSPFYHNDVCIFRILLKVLWGTAFPASLPAPDGLFPILLLLTPPGLAWLRLMMPWESTSEQGLCTHLMFTPGKLCDSSIYTNQGPINRTSEFSERAQSLSQMVLLQAGILSILFPNWTKMRLFNPLYVTFSSSVNWSCSDVLRLFCSEWYRACSTPNPVTDVHHRTRDTLRTDSTGALLQIHPLPHHHRSYVFVKSKVLKSHTI